MAPRETEDNAYAKFWSDKQRALWYAMVLLEWFNSQRGRDFGQYPITLQGTGCSDSKHL